MTEHTVEDRLARVEAQLERIANILETKGPGLFGTATQHASQALGNIYGNEEVQERVGELVLRLGEPDTLEALTRIGVMLPKIEYALHFAAAGPELLEEGLQMVREELEHQGSDSADLDRRVQAAKEALTALSRPDTLKAVSQLTEAASGAAPAVEALGQATAAVAEVEGKEEMQTRLTETLTLLVQAETLDSLARIAALAPQIEYSVNFLAAGPELLEEGLEMVRERAHEQGWDQAEMQRRLTSGTDALVALSDPAILKALTALAPTVKQLADRASRIDLEPLVQVGEAAADPQVSAALNELVRLAPNLAPALSSLPIQPRTLEILRTINQAVEDAAAKKNQVGPVGAFLALRQPQTQVALGFLLTVAESLGAHLADTKKQLPSGQ